MVSTRSMRQPLLAPLEPATKRAPRLVRQQRTQPRSMRRTTIHKRWPTDLATYSAVGMFNPFNYCYRRALFQCLLHMPSFINFLNLGHVRCQDRSKCALCAFSHLSYVYWMTLHSAEPQVNAAVAQLDAAINHWSEHAPGLGSPYKEFKHHNQEDAVDMLVGLTLRTEAESALTWQHSSEELGAAMTRLLYLQVEHVRERNCGHPLSSEVVSEPVLRLTMQQTSNGIDLESLLDNYFGPHAVEAACGQASCTAGTGFTSTAKITRLPLVLAVNLVRSTGGPKIEHQVRTAQRLDLQRWCKGIRSTATYSLRAIVAHDGKELHAGHYTALVASGDDAWLSWVNDQTARRWSRARLIHQLEGALPPDAGQSYLLFYQKD